MSAPDSKTARSYGMRSGRKCIARQTVAKACSDCSRTKWSLGPTGNARFAKKAIALHWARCRIAVKAPLDSSQVCAFGAGVADPVQGHLPRSALRGAVLPYVRSRRLCVVVLPSIHGRRLLGEGETHDGKGRHAGGGPRRQLCNFHRFGCSDRSCLFLPV